MQYEFPSFQPPSPDPDLPMPGFGILTVSELTLYINDRLELDPDLQDVRLACEISNLTRAASGHLYFTLKDAEASIRVK